MCPWCFPRVPVNFLVLNSNPTLDADVATMFVKKKKVLFKSVILGVDIIEPRPFQWQIPATAPL